MKKSIAGFFLAIVVAVVVIFFFDGCGSKPQIREQPTLASGSDLNPRVADMKIRDEIALRCATSPRDLKESPEATSRRCYALADRMLMERVKS